MFSGVIRKFHKGEMVTVKTKNETLTRSVRKEMEANMERHISNSGVRKKRKEKKEAEAEAETSDP